MEEVFPSNVVSSLYSFLLSKLMNMDIPARGVPFASIL